VSSLERVAEGVYRLGTDWVGWYLCRSDGQVTVVDCGFPGYFDQLPPALSELGLSLDAVAAVVLTHYHGDHVGCAERIRTETGAPVFAPAGDANGVTGAAKVPTPGGMLGSLWRPRMMRFIAHATAKGGAKQIPVAEVHGYDDGEQLEVPGALRGQGCLAQRLPGRGRLRSLRGRRARVGLELAGSREDDPRAQRDGPPSRGD